MTRTKRLFAITEYLRGRRTGVTAEQLAERFGVTMRTIYRDLDALRESELPVQADRGRGGGYALDRSYSLPPVNFTAREAALLIAAGRYLNEMRMMPFSETIASALDKVRAALSSSSQRELLGHLEGLRFTGVPAKPVDKDVARAVEQAWFENAVLVIHYLDSSYVETCRRVRIESVVIERSETLLLCQDLDKNEGRPFRMNRILRAYPERRAL